MSENLYSEPRIVTGDDVLNAVYDYVLTYALPALDSNNIIRGWENLSYLPAGTQEYAVITLISTARVGTNVVTDHMGADGYGEDEETISTLRQIDVQIDFCSTGIAAGQRANCIETVSRSSAGVDFFRMYGLSCLYADDVRSVDFVDGTKQQVHRHITTLHLAGWFSVGVTIQHAEATSARIENIDVHHPANRK